MHYVIRVLILILIFILIPSSSSSIHIRPHSRPSSPILIPSSSRHCSNLNPLGTYIPSCRSPPPPQV